MDVRVDGSGVMRRRGSRWVTRRNDRFSLTTNLQQRLFKIGGRLIKHARY